MRLRELRIEDSDKMLEWMHDSEIQKNFQRPMQTYTKQDVECFISKAQIKAQHGGMIHFAIVDEFDEYMGTISLKNIDMNSGNAEFAISLRRVAQGRGIAYEATLEILRYAFESIGLNKVYLNVLADNERAWRLYEKCGFIYEGTFRKHLYCDGRYKDLKWYSILKDEFC